MGHKLDGFTFLIPHIFCKVLLKVLQCQLQFKLLLKFCLIKFTLPLGSPDWYEWVFQSSSSWLKKIRMSTHINPVKFNFRFIKSCYKNMSYDPVVSAFEVDFSWIYIREPFIHSCFLWLHFFTVFSDTLSIFSLRFKMTKRN